MKRGPTYEQVMVRHRESALLASSVLRAFSADRALPMPQRVDCMVAMEALESAIEFADSRPIKTIKQEP